MKTWIILGCMCLIVQVQSIQQNVTKRGVHDQISYYADPTPLRYIQVSASNVHPSNFYTNTNHASDYPVQQVLYDYPNGTPDHVQSSTTQYLNQPQVPIATPIQHPHTAIATPVQHGAVVHHGQSYSRFVHPYPAPAPAPAPAPIAPAPAPHINPHIYTYNNGKVLYQPQRTNPNHHPQQPPPVVTQKPFKASPLISTTYYKPVMKNTEEHDDDDDRRKPANTRDEDNEHEQEHYEEEEEEEEFKPYKYKSSKYSDSDDDDEHAHYRVQEDDEDDRFSRNTRKPGGSKRYSTNNKPKSHYKSFKYSTNSKPKKEIYESRQSQNIPIVHKQSFHQEKWIVTKKD